MGLTRENNIAHNFKSVFKVDTLNVRDVGKLTPLLLGLPPVVGIEFDLAVVPHEIILYSDKKLSIEKVQEVLLTNAFEAKHRKTTQLNIIPKKDGMNKTKENIQQLKQ